MASQACGVGDCVQTSPEDTSRDQGTSADHGASSNTELDRCGRAGARLQQSLRAILHAVRLAVFDSCSADRVRSFARTAAHLYAGRSTCRWEFELALTLARSRHSCRGTLGVGGEATGRRAAHRRTDVGGYTIQHATWVTYNMQQGDTADAPWHRCRLASRGKGGQRCRALA